jgi:hypothetical protein
VSGLESDLSQAKGDLTAKAKEMDDLKASAEEELNSLRQEHSTASTQLETTIADLRSDADLKVKESLGLQNRIADLSSQLTMASDDLQSKAQEIERKQVELVESGAKIDQLQSDHEASKVTIASLQIERDDLQGKASALESELVSAQKNLTSKTQEIENKHALYEELGREMENMQAQHRLAMAAAEAEHQAALEMKLRTIEEKEASLVSLENARSDLQGRFTSLGAELTTTMDGLAQKTKEVEDMQNRFIEHGIAVEKLQAEHRVVLESQQNSADTAIHKIQTEKDAMQNKVHDLDALLTSAQRELVMKSEEMVSLQQESDDQISTLQSAHKEAILKREASKMLKVEESNKLQNQVSILDKEIATLQTSAATEAAERARVIEELHSRVSGLALDLSTAQEDLEAKSEAVVTVTSQSESQLRSILAQHSAATAQLQASMHILQHEADVKTREGKELKTQVASLDGRLSTALDDLAMKTETVANAQARISVLDTELLTTRSNLETKSLTLENVESQLVERTAVLEDKQAEMKEKEATLASLQEEREDLKQRVFTLDAKLISALDGLASKTTEAEDLQAQFTEHGAMVEKQQAEQFEAFQRLQAEYTTSMEKMKAEQEARREVEEKFKFAAKAKVKAERRTIEEAQAKALAVEQAQAAGDAKARAAARSVRQKVEKESAAKLEVVKSEAEKQIMELNEHSLELEAKVEEETKARAQAEAETHERNTQIALLMQELLAQKKAHEEEIERREAQVREELREKLAADAAAKSELEERLNIERLAQMEATRQMLVEVEARKAMEVEMHESVWAAQEAKAAAEDDAQRWMLKVAERIAGKSSPEPSPARAKKEIVDDKKSSPRSSATPNRKFSASERKVPHDFTPTDVSDQMLASIEERPRSSKFSATPPRKVSGSSIAPSRRMSSVSPSRKISFDESISGPKSRRDSTSTVSSTFSDESDDRSEQSPGECLSKQTSNMITPGDSDENLTKFRSVSDTASMEVLSKQSSLESSEISPRDTPGKSMQAFQKGKSSISFDGKSDKAKTKYNASARWAKHVSDKKANKRDASWNNVKRRRSAILREVGSQLDPQRQSRSAATAYNFKSITAGLWKHEFEASLASNSIVRDETTMRPKSAFSPPSGTMEAFAMSASTEARPKTTPHTKKEYSQAISSWSDAGSMQSPDALADGSPRSRQNLSASDDFIYENQEDHVCPRDKAGKCEYCQSGGKTIEWRAVQRKNRDIYLVTEFNFSKPTPLLPPKEKEVVPSPAFFNDVWNRRPQTAGASPRFDDRDIGMMLKHSILSRTTSRRNSLDTVTPARPNTSPEVVRNEKGNNSQRQVDWTAQKPGPTEENTPSSLVRGRSKKGSKKKLGLTAHAHDEHAKKKSLFQLKMNLPKSGLSNRNLNARSHPAGGRPTSASSSGRALQSSPSPRAVINALRQSIKDIDAANTSERPDTAGGADAPGRAERQRSSTGRGNTGFFKDEDFLGSFGFAQSPNDQMSPLSLAQGPNIRRSFHGMSGKSRDISSMTISNITTPGADTPGEVIHLPEHQYKNVYKGPRLPLLIVSKTSNK